jgi:hypothetical protein
MSSYEWFYVHSDGFCGYGHHKAHDIPEHCMHYIVHGAVQ